MAVGDDDVIVDASFSSLIVFDSCRSKWMGFEYPRRMLMESGDGKWKQMREREREGSGGEEKDQVWGKWCINGQWGSCGVNDFDFLA